MAKVTLFEDTSGSLYLHKTGDDIVYGHIEVMVPYGATFGGEISMPSDIKYSYAASGFGQPK